MSEQQTNEHGQLDPRAVELVNGKIDGELGPGESDELDALLAASEEVRGYSEALRACTRVLDELPELDPPPWLQNVIEKQVRLPERAGGAASAAGFKPAWLPRRWLQTGFALAAGAVLTIGIYEMGSEPVPEVDIGKMSGTIIKNPDAAGGELLDSVQLTSDALAGQVSLRQLDELFQLEVDLSSDGPVELAVRIDGEALEFEGIKRRQDLDDGVTIGDEAIFVTSNGQQSYTLNLRHKPGAGRDKPLELAFYANGLLVHEAILSLSGGD